LPACSWLSGIAHGADDVQRAGEDGVDQLAVARRRLVPGRPGVALVALLGDRVVDLKAAARTDPLVGVAVDDQRRVAACLCSLIGLFSYEISSKWDGDEPGRIVVGRTPGWGG